MASMASAVLPIASPAWVKNGACSCQNESRPYMVMKEEREVRDGRRTGGAVKHDRASDGERRVGRPRRIVPLVPSFCARLASRM